MKGKSWLKPPQQLKLVWNYDGSWRGFLHSNLVLSTLISWGEKENNILATECPLLINNIKLSSCNTYMNLCISRSTSLVWYHSWLNFILQPLPSPGERIKTKQNNTKEKTNPHTENISILFRGEERIKPWYGLLLLKILLQKRSLSLNAKPPLNQTNCCLCFTVSATKRNKNFQTWLGCYLTLHMISYSALNLSAMWRS